MEFKFQLEQHSMTLLSLNLLSQLSRERGVAKLALCGGLEVVRRGCGARRLRRCGVGSGDGSDLHIVSFEN